MVTLTNNEFLERRLRHGNDQLLQNGAHGQGKAMHGANAEDLVVKVPLGTVVTDLETNSVIADIVEKDDKSMKRYEEKIRSHFLYLSYAPIVFVSALKNQRIQTLFEQINIVYENYNRKVPTNVLNDVILDATLLNQAPIFNGNRLKISYCSQVSVAPPTFVMFANDPNYLHFSYQRYLENKIREAFAFEGSPIKIIIRKKEE